MNRHVLLAVIVGFTILIACVKVEEVNYPVEAEGAKTFEPAPPPGGHDDAFAKLPQPFSVDDAKRVLIEATVFAPWGIGLGGPPLQAQALNVLLGQPNPGALLDAVYREAQLPGQLLALCGLRTADPERYAAYSSEVLSSNKTVVTYSGCLADDQSIADVLAEISSTPICSDIPKSKQRILAMCRRAG